MPDKETDIIFNNKGSKMNNKTSKRTPEECRQILKALRIDRANQAKAMAPLHAYAKTRINPYKQDEWHRVSFEMKGDFIHGLDIINIKHENE